MADFTDTSGDDSLIGSAGDDTFELYHGGDDTARGQAGNDVFDLRDTLNAADAIDGGDGYDIARISGAGYETGVRFTAATLVNVEELDIGDEQAEVFRLTFNDTTVAAGQTMEVTFSGSGRIDGSAETDGQFSFLLVAGTWAVTGGGGDDLLIDMAAWNRRDHIDGGGGVDTVTFRDDLSDIRFGRASLHNVEILNLPDLVTVKMNDANVAAGQTLQVNLGDASVFNGSAERDGAYDIHGLFEGETISGGRGADTIDGDQGDDVITGHAGADSLTGGWDNDTFVYLSVRDSTVRAMDHITDLESGDRIDLSAIDADTTLGGNQAFRLVSSFDHQAGEAALAYDAGADQTLLSLDVDGDGKADAVIALDGDHRDFTNFAL